MEIDECRISPSNYVSFSLTAGGSSLVFARGILTLLQIEDALSHPATRTAAFVSLICALMSLLYGGVYILRFGTMRGMDKAKLWSDVSTELRIANGGNCTESSP
jgi:hypothetical protein